MDPLTFIAGTSAFIVGVIALARTVPEFLLVLVKLVLWYFLLLYIMLDVLLICVPEGREMFYHDSNLVFWFHFVLVSAIIATNWGLRKVRTHAH